MGCCHPQNRQSLDYPKTLPATSSKRLILSASDFITVKSVSLTESYKIQGLISRGSLSQTQKAIHIQSNSCRVIKTIPLPSSQLLIRSLLQEISILKKLDHPGIVKIYELYRNDPKLHIVSEFLAGEELFDRIKELKKFSENQAARCVKELAGALIHCHQQGIVHGNIKPENILYENKEENAKLKLVGFGNSLYYLEKPDEEVTYYKAPEALQGKVAKESDVWSLGVILYILLSGSPPFTGNSPTEIRESIKSLPLSFSHQNWKFVSDEAKDLLSKMLNKNTKNRLTIEEVFHNYWVKMRSCDLLPDKKLQETTLTTLSNFKTESHLQKVVFTYIVSQRMHSEQFSKLREVFELIDKNGDGSLSYEELQMAVIEHKLDLDVDKIIEECDINKSGSIDYTEFLMASVEHSKAYNKQKIKEVFDELDINKDGKISVDELKTLIGGDRERKHLVDRIIEETDVDGDGEIDLDEFMAKFDNLE